jgi:hypothetical protein
MTNEHHRAIEEELARLVDGGGRRPPLLTSRFRIAEVKLNGQWPNTKLLVRCDDSLRGGTELFDFQLWGREAEYSLDVETPTTAAALMLADIADTT